MFDILIRFAVFGAYSAAGLFMLALVLSLFSKRANHVLNCGKHTMKVCEGKQVFLVCYDCGLRIGKGWNVGKADVHPEPVRPGGHRPDGLRLSFDSSWAGLHLRRGDAGRPGGEVV